MERLGGTRLNRKILVNKSVEMLGYDARASSFPKVHEEEGINENGYCTINVLLQSLCSRGLATTEQVSVSKAT
jgi:hypothetical protein